MQDLLAQLMGQTAEAADRRAAAGASPSTPSAAEHINIGSRSKVAKGATTALPAGVISIA